MSHQYVTLLLPGYTATSGDETIVPVHPCHAAFRFTQDAEQQPWQSQLATIMGLDTAGGKRLPIAGRSADEGAAGLVRADPVSLKADRDTAKLMPAELLDLSETEADELLHALNEFVAGDGFRFFRESAGEWYMSGMSADALESYPPSFLADRNASAFMPEGDSAAPWRSLMTEIQMLLHMQPVNELREQKGLLPVNSVWFWGGAPVSEKSAVNTDVLVFTDNAEALALTQLTGVQCEPLEAFTPASVAQSQARHVVIVDNRLVSAWLRADGGQLQGLLAQLNEHWLLPLVQLVGKGELQQVQVLTEDGLYGMCDKDSVNTTGRSDGAPAWWARLASVFRPAP